MREFLFTQQFLPDWQVPTVSNQVIYYNMSHFANYRLQKGNLTDLTRPMTLTANASGNPSWSFDDAPVDMC